MNNSQSKHTIALYASPKCREKPQLRRYKSYYNVAWFVRAYSKILSAYDRVITTDETLTAVLNADSNTEELYKDYWRVPDLKSLYDIKFEAVGEGFDAQVALAAEVAQRRVERLLLFQDPLDVLEHLPEMYALVRNCTLANVGLHINVGATFWAETQWQKRKLTGSDSMFGPWRSVKEQKALHILLNPSDQTIAFISHDSEKQLMSELIFEYRKQFQSPEFHLTGTHGTCEHAKAYYKRQAPNEAPLNLRPAGEDSTASHGPTGGDVIIAHEILDEWKPSTLVHEKPPVRIKGTTHTVVFYIDHKHAQPHMADIHVLLRTCLHPNNGVNLILNDLTAREWAGTLRDKLLG